MLPKYHITIGAIITTIIFSIFPITPLQATIIFLSSFLIDVDHYLIYAFKTKDYSLKNSRKFFHKRREDWLKLSIRNQKNYKRYIYFFHGIEFWLILIFLTKYIYLMKFILIGIAIHMILDYIDFLYYKQPLYAKFSQFYVYFTNKKKMDFL